jgi:alanine-glyoxylate transaminase/serine-glyoxylate transaminase/serine-pyruvate transaminase
MHCAVFDHRGPECAELGRGLLTDFKAVFKTTNRVVIYLASGTGAWEAAIDAAQHPALLMVAKISSLGSIDFQTDAWRIDVGVAGSQKGVMLPPGMSFNGTGVAHQEGGMHAAMSYLFAHVS